MNLYQMFSFYYSEKKKENLIFVWYLEALMSNITPDFGIVIADINLQVSPNNDCIVMEAISVMVSVLYIS